MFKVFYDCQAKREVDGVALLAFSLRPRACPAATVHAAPPPSPSPGCAAAAASAVANRKKQSTRVFKINCYDGFC